MARSKKNTGFQRIITVVGVLIVVEVVYLGWFGGGREPVSMRDAINTAVAAKTELSTQRQAQLKIQLALGDFRAKNRRLPASLNELVPVYFDVVPLDPETNQPFPYRVDGVRYYLGTEPTPAPAGGAAPAGGGASVAPGEQAELIASLDGDNKKEGFIYDPTGKRDPFRPFDFSPKNNNKGATPLEKYNLGQLKLTAVLEGFDEPSAIVENAAGKGFTVKKGTKIGPNGGEVIEILKDKLLILEKSVDFTGQAKTQTVELKLRTKDQEQQNGSGQE